MKKVWKITSLIGVVCIAIGATLSITSLALGAQTSIYFRDGEIVVGEMKINGEGFFNTTSVFEEVNTGGIQVEAFDEIDASLKMISIEVVEGEDYSIDLRYRSPEKITYNVENGVLIINQKDSFYTRKMNQVEGTIKVTIPKDKELRQIDIDNGIGAVTLSDCKAERLSIDIGLGEVTIENSSIDTLDVDGGLGTITSHNLKTGDITIDAGMGEILLQGTFAGDINVQGGMGEIVIDTTLKQQDYNYDIEKGMGTITLNNKAYGLLENVAIENDTDYTMTLTGGMGDIEVKTSEE